MQENTEMSLKYAKVLLDLHASSPLPLVRELVFLRQGDYWPSSSHEPYNIERVGQGVPVQLLIALEELLPSLNHVDFVHLCYRKDPVKDIWHGRLRTCQH